MSTSTHASTTHSAPAKNQTDGRGAVVEAAFPAPAPLATPTDLAPQEAQAVTNALNQLIADLFALYLKTKNFHWHLLRRAFSRLPPALRRARRADLCGH